MVIAYVPTGGRKVRASEVKAIVDQANSLTAPGWTSFTPSWTSAGVAPAIGNGTIQGWYRRPAGSDEIDMVWRWVAGSTTTYGTSTWYFSLPVAANANSVLRCTGPAYINDFGTADKCGCVKLVTTTTIAFIASTTVVSATTPQTFATNDVLLGALSYEPA